MNKDIAYIASTAQIPETFVFEVGEIDALRDFLTDFIQSGDTVLYKASNGMKLSDAIV